MFRFILLLCCALLFVACSKPSEPFATSTELAALMHVVFPEGKEGEPVRAALPSEPDEASAGEVADSVKADFTPRLVVRLSADQVVLIVSGVPVSAGHASQGALVAYWFERREKNWYLAKKPPQAVSSGFFGEVGDVKLIEPADDLKVLAIENGSCWQGMCGRWLQLFRVDAQGMTDLLAKEQAIQLATDARDATESCEDLLKRDDGAQTRVSADAYSENYGCVDVSAKWYVQVRKDKGGPGDIVLEYSGKQTTAELVPVEQPAAQASAPAAMESAPQAAATGGEDEAPDSEYRVTIHDIREKLIYRYQKGQYVHLSGKNPAPGI